MLRSVFMKVAAVLAGSLALGAQAASLVPTNFTACRATRCTTSQGHVMTSQPFDLESASNKLDTCSGSGGR